MSQQPKSLLLVDLLALKDLLSDPSRWAKGHCAKDARGRSTFVFSPSAVSWSLDGACMKVAPDSDRFGVLYDAMLEIVAGPNPDELALIIFNNEPNTTHADIMKIIFRAIRKAENI